jgi:tetratricopeptide (TPR) repeat protein
VPFVTSWFRPKTVSALATLLSFVLAGCAGVGVSTPPLRSDAPLTTSSALGQGDPTRDASLRLVIAGLDEDEAGRPSRAVASYQRAIRVDATNAFAYLALARHHLEYGSPGEASAFLEQARALFEAEGRLGPPVDVWGVGLRAWIDRGMGNESAADARFDAARELSPEIWADELLSAHEMR